MEKVYSLDEERYYDYDDLLEQIENENLDDYFRTTLLSEIIAVVIELVSKQQL